MPYVDLDIILSHQRKYAYYARKRYGWLPGSNSKRIYSNAGYKPTDVIDFLDYPFKDGDTFLEQHLELVQHFRPRYAVCPDIFEKSKLNFLIDYSYKLQEYSPRVIIVPKVLGIIDHIPNDFIIGYSVPSGYASTPVTPLEIGQRRVHLLGGGVKKILDLMNYLNVISFDFNSWAKGVFKGGWYYVYEEKRLRPQKSFYQHDADERMYLTIDALGSFWNDKKSNVI